MPPMSSTPSRSSRAARSVRVPPPGVDHRSSALDAAARLSDRYISDRQLPDKAIDLIDEAGSRLRIRRMTAPPDLREFDDRIADVRKEKESAIDAQDFEKAASLRDVEKNLLAEKASGSASGRPAILTSSPRSTRS
jgi:ATP-dependent Clp protease ATP-binding subunit ClpA